MSFIATIPPAESSGELREMYERQQESWGFVPNYALTFSHRPEVLARWAQLLSAIRRPMDDRRFELVTFAAAQVYRHTGCALAHGKELARFIGEDGVHELASRLDCEQLTDAEWEMLRYARKLAADAADVSQDDIDRLKAHGLSDGEIFDIAAAVAGRAFLTKVLDGLGMEPDAALANLPQSLVAALTVGRPVSSRESCSI